MEWIGLGIFALIMIAVGHYYGFFDSVETAARMANRKMERLESEQIKEDIDFYKEHKLSDEDFKDAIASKKQFHAFRGL